MEKILVVEDEKDIQEMLSIFLEEENYEVVCANDGIEAMELFKTYTPDLVLLDVMLPKMDGYAVCELIRKESDVPLIMITALFEEDYQIKGLDLKADDYITKPFSMPILLRKIEAILRRCQQSNKKSIIRYNNITLNISEHLVYADKKVISLTAKEFEIIRTFLENPGIVITRDSLLEKIWQYEYVENERVVDNHIKNIRKKLTDLHIKTIKGVGYKIDKNN